MQLVNSADTIPLGSYPEELLLGKVEGKALPLQDWTDP